MADTALHDRQISELFDSRNEHEKRLTKLESWKLGNGARGAEIRLQEIEKNKLDKVEFDELKDQQRQWRIDHEKLHEDMNRNISSIPAEIAKQARGQWKEVREWAKVLIPLFIALIPYFLITGGGK